MKKVALAFIISFLALGSFAQTQIGSFVQTQKVTVFCRVIGASTARVTVDYLNLPQLLPDSLKTELLFAPKKGRKITDALLSMSLNGWKVITYEGSVYPGIGSYLLSKDIYLSDEAKALFVQRLNAL
jgi:hypothetical protein